MKILALDSTAKTSSVAVLENDELLGLFSANIKNNHSETLLPMVKSLLDSLKLTNEDIDAYAVSEGPGSFTGVRIGVATIKGLAFGRQKPCVGVSTIEALYENLSDYDGVVCPIMNARRGQVYTGAFLNGERFLDDCCMMLDDLIPMLLEKGQAIRFNGDGYDLVLIVNHEFHARIDIDRHSRYGALLGDGLVARGECQHGCQRQNHQCKT